MSKTAIRHLNDLKNYNNPWHTCVNVWHTSVSGNYILQCRGTTSNVSRRDSARGKVMKCSAAVALGGVTDSGWRRYIWCGARCCHCGHTRGSSPPSPLMPRPRPPGRVVITKPPASCASYHQDFELQCGLSISSWLW